METILLDYADWIRHATMFSWAGQNLNWLLTKFLYSISVATETLVDKVFSVFGFLDYPVIQSIYQTFQRVSLWILIVAIAVLGLTMMIKGKGKLKDSFLHIIILCCVIVQLPLLINSGMTLAKNIFTATNELVSSEVVPEASLSFNIVKVNTADMYFVASQDQGFDLLNEPGSVKNGMKENEFLPINLATILEPGDVDDLKKSSGNDDVEALKYYLVSGEDGEGIETEKISNWFSWFKEGSFRYTGNFRVMNVSFIILIVFNLLLFTKLIFICINVLYDQLLFPLVAFTDIQTAERPKKLGMSIVISILTIELLGLSRSLFMIYYAFIDTLDFNFVGFFILGIAGAIAFLKGSDSLARQFGIDTGMKDGLMTAAALYAGYRATKAGAGVVKQGAEATGEFVEKLPEKAKQSVQDAKDSAVRTAGAVGQTAGRISESGLKDFAVDTIQTGASQVKDSAKNMGENAKKAVTEPLSEVNSSFEKGVGYGVADGYNAKVQKASDSALEDSNGPKSPPTTRAKVQETDTYLNIPIDKHGQAVQSTPEFDSKGSYDYAATPESPPPKKSTVSSSTEPSTQTSTKGDAQSSTDELSTTKIPEKTLASKGAVPQSAEADRVSTQTTGATPTAPDSTVGTPDMQAPTAEKSQVTKEHEVAINEQVSTSSNHGAPPDVPHPASADIPLKQGETIQQEKEITIQQNETRKNVEGTSIQNATVESSSSVAAPINETQNQEVNTTVLQDYQTKINENRPQQPSRFKDLYKNYQPTEHPTKGGDTK